MLVMVAMTHGLIGCARVSHVPAGSLYPPSGILMLTPGQTYQAQANETWHSAARYQQLELSYIDAIAALKQVQR
jgi:hypothetical protein